MTRYVPLFRASLTIKTLTQLHAHLTVSGLQKDHLACTKLIESYSKMGSLQSSRLIFDNFPNPDSFMWGVLIKCHVWSGFFHDSIFLFQRLLFEITQLSNFIFPSVLRACSAVGDLGFGEKLHGKIVKCAFEDDPVIGTSLLSMYGEMGCLDNARKVFECMPVRDVVTWSSIISSHVENGYARDGLYMLAQMVVEGVGVDSVTMLSAAEACGELQLSQLAKSVHCFVVRRNIRTDGALDTSLVSMYMKCRDLNSSERLFALAVDKNTSLWTAKISGYHQNDYHQEALGTFIKMQGSDVEPNAVTLMCVLCSCARLGWLKEGKSIHGFVIRAAIDLDNAILGPALVDLYANCGRFTDAHNVFDRSQDMRAISWNMLISGYAREGMSEEAFKLFKQMLVHGIILDSFTISSVLVACVDIGFSQLGCQIHCQVVKTGFANEYLQNSLIGMYCRCGMQNSAYSIFCKTQQKGVVEWNNMLCGFSQNGNPDRALTLFQEMCFNSSEMDEVTFLSAIQACSNLGSMEKGKWVHNKLITYGLKDIYVDTALIDMYAKCGDLQMARKAFISMSAKNVVSWTAMIGAYGRHGYVDAAIEDFNKMVDSGIRPNEVTCMNILSACSHAGYLEKGKLFFNTISRTFGIEPSSEHYGCLVDLMSRAGDLHGAYEVIKSMSTPADASIWSALINGCRIHRRMDIIETIKESLVHICTDDTGYYTLLSDLYAEGEEWNKFNMVRSIMKSRGLEKVQGYSMIEIDNKGVHSFGADYKSHSQTNINSSSLENLQSLPQSHIIELDAFGT